MAFEKILILESNWAGVKEDYIKDSRSATRIYRSIGSLLSVHEKPVIITERPLLKSRFIKDIRQFTELEANQTGFNLIILSAHGKFKRLEKQKPNGEITYTNKRKLDAVDGTLRISRKIHSLKGNLRRTVFLLDACEVGKRIEAFRSTGKALGAIGFEKEVDWVDSACFILTLLLKFQISGVFQKEEGYLKELNDVIDAMQTGGYGPLMKKLGVVCAFRKEE